MGTALLSYDDGMTSPAARPMTTPSVAAALYLGTVAFMITGIQPVLFGRLTEEGRLTDAMLGRIAWTEVVAIAAASALGPRLLKALPYGWGRWAITLACVGLTLANAVVFVSHDIAALFEARLFAGLLEGLLLATTNLAVTRALHPERLSALFLMVSAIPQVAAAYTLPAIVMPRFGADSGFVLLAVLSAVGIGIGLLLGNEVHDSPPVKADTPVWTPAVCLGLVGVLLQNAGNGAAWEYQARIGESLHFSGNVVGIAIAADLIFQIVATLTVASTAWRMPFRFVLVTSCFIQAGILFAMAHVSGPGMYVAVCAAFGALWLGVNPFQVRLIVDLDETRQAALVVAALQLIGFGVGPLVCSFLVRQGDVGRVFLGGAALIAVSLCFYTAALLLDRRAQRAVAVELAG